MTVINCYNFIVLLQYYLKYIMKKIVIFCLAILLSAISVTAQKPKKPNASEIYQSIQNLNFLGTAMYIAAHPDDENTRLISYLANDLHARTAYLSLTRGDGGQNLIGPEIREMLGLIRTNELLAARSIDGGEQFFTRANDFGYSKHPNETLDLWNKKEVLNDVVKIIRQFKPDIIVNRFDAKSAGRTHGHHTSSAMLSLEAFDLAPQPDYKTKTVEPWQVKRIFFNTSWWFYGSQEKFEKADKSKMFQVNVGEYYPWKGLSNSEIASLSRSMHKSQGFGSTGSRGDEMEYLELLKGDMPKQSLFDGINTTWSRVEGGKAIGKILKEVEDNFDFITPSKSIPKLMQAYQLIKDLKDDYWREYKTKQIKDIIAACAGLFLEVKSNEPYGIKKERIPVAIEAINRSAQPMILESVVLLPQKTEIEVAKPLEHNKDLDIKNHIEISENSAYTSPYWLNDKASMGMYFVENESLIGQPINRPELKARFNLNIEGQTISFERDVIYKYNDPVKGEVYQPFQVIPEISTSIASSVVIFNSDTPKQIPVKVVNHTSRSKGTVNLEVPEGWQVFPENIPFEINEKDAEQTVYFNVTPPSGQSTGYISPRVNVGHKTFNQDIVSINYDHIPNQFIVKPAKAKVVKLNLKTKSKIIGYINGAGDDIPQSLRQAGYQVEIIPVENISVNSLKKYDAIIVGIRAYNTIDNLRLKQKDLLEYVHSGGNMIVQYNTSHRLKINGNLAPYPLELSRDRVTDENSEVKFLNKDAEILNFPNQITRKDFDGWVQERGLYFPNKWATEFKPILSMHDKGESAKKGSLLIAKYGKGNYIYTGLSFFRELPAGVPGAFKLFANMIDAGRQEEQQLKN